MGSGITSLIDYETTKLIIEGITICVLYLVTMIILIMCKKEWWIQEYPDKVREVYFADEQRNGDRRKKESLYYGRLCIKKIIALIIYIIVMLTLARTVELVDIFVMESYVCCLVIWPAVTLVEAIFLDVIIIGHWKKIRLPGTETLHKEYRGIYKKAFKDVLLGVAFGVITYAVLFGVFMVTINIEMEKTRQEMAVLERQIEALENGTYRQRYQEASRWRENEQESAWDEEYAQLQESVFNPSGHGRGQLYRL